MDALNELISPRQVVDELRYRSYAFNRERSPQVSPERWARIYPNVDAMEERFEYEGLRRGEFA